MDLFDFESAAVAPTPATPLRMPGGDTQLDWVERETGERRGRLPPAERHRTRCLICGRPLQGHESRAAGMGPVCRGERDSRGHGQGADPGTLDWLDRA